MNTCRSAALAQSLHGMQFHLEILLELQAAYFSSWSGLYLQHCSGTRLPELNLAQSSLRKHLSYFVFQENVLLFWGAPSLGRVVKLYAVIRITYECCKEMQRLQCACIAIFLSFSTFIVFTVCSNQFHYKIPQTLCLHVHSSLNFHWIYKWIMYICIKKFVQHSITQCIPSKAINR